MKKMLAVILILLAMCCSAFAANNPDVWKNAESAAANASVPDELTDSEAEIYRQGFAAGFFAALNPENNEGHYIVNIKNGKFHYPSCNGVAAMNPENREDFYGTREDALKKGYKPCGLCDP